MEEVMRLDEGFDLEEANELFPSEEDCELTATQKLRKIRCLRMFENVVNSCSWWKYRWISVFLDKLLTMMIENYETSQRSQQAKMRYDEMKFRDRYDYWLNFSSSKSPILILNLVKLIIRIELWFFSRKINLVFSFFIFELILRDSRCQTKTLQSSIMDFLNRSNGLQIVPLECHSYLIFF